MRIAFVSTILDYPYGGADTLWTHAARAAVERGDTVLRVASAEVLGHPAVSGLGGASFARAPRAVPVGLGARIAARVRRARGSLEPFMQAVAGFRPDLLVVSQGGTYEAACLPGWFEWLSREPCAVRLVANCQDEAPVLPQGSVNRVRALFGRCDRVFFVSTRNLQVTRAHLGDAVPKAEVIQNPLRWTPAPPLAWPASDALELACVSRLHPVKGVDLALRALAKLPPATPWQLRIYGRGPQEQELRALTTQLGLTSRVAFMGYEADLGAIWARNQMLVSTSIEDGVPMTIPEAMLLGRPVLSTRVGGAPDWIEDGRTGYLCGERTVDAVAATLARAAADRDRLAGMGLEASRTASGRYRPEDYRRLVAPV
jgi:glycosyltransferase involved in cell wall biosynthesis